VLKAEIITAIDVQPGDTIPLEGKAGALKRRR